MNLRLFDWIWHIRGSVPLPSGQSSDEAFDRLDPLFRERDTSHDRAHDTLTFRKSNQAPQDQMSIFDGGALRIEHGEAGPVLRYDLTSRILLFCFLAPLLFLAFAQLNIAIGMLDQPTAAEKAEKEKKKEEDEKKHAARQLNPIDRFLGAPAPEKPKTDAEKKKEEAKKKAEGEEEDDEGPSPKSGYIFAAIFASLYVGGRILEGWLVKRLFKKSLLGSEPAPLVSAA